MPLAMGMPELANGPVRYVNSGTSVSAAACEIMAEAPTRLATATPRTICFKRIMSLPCASAGAWSPRPLHPPLDEEGYPSRALRPGRGNCLKCALSIRERPHPEFLLPDLPKPGQASRLRDQEENDEYSQRYEVDVLEGRRGHREAQRTPNQAQHDGQTEYQGGAEERTEQAAEAADDDHKQNEKRLIDAEALGLRVAEPQEDQHGARDAAVERRYREGEQLGRIEFDADQLGGDVHVAHRHPGTPDAPADQVRGEPRHYRDDREHDEIARDRRGVRPGDRNVEQRPRRHFDGSRNVVIVEPRDADEAPRQEKLRRQRRHRQIEAFDAQAGHAENDAGRCSQKAGADDQYDDIDAGEKGRELVASERAYAHETAGAERQQARVAGEQIEPDRGERIDQHRNENGVDHEGGSHERHQNESHGQDQDDADLVLPDRKQRLIRLIARLVLAGFAIKHGRPQIRSMMRSPNRPCGRNSRKTSAMT